MLALFLSLVAVLLASGAWIVMRRGSAASLSKQYSQLSDRIASCELIEEKLTADLRAMRMARNMAAHRQRQLDLVETRAEPGPPAQQDIETEKARIRQELNAGIARGVLSGNKAME